MYKVVHSFWDMEDKTRHTYKVGDEFPYDGRKIKKQRLDELASKDNKIGEILIYFEEFNSTTSNDLNSDNGKESNELDDNQNENNDLNSSDLDNELKEK